MVRWYLVGIALVAACGGTPRKPAAAEPSPELEQAALAFEHDGCEEPMEKSLDPGRYQLDASTTAIGVRFVCHSEFPAGEAVETWLHLYRVNGEKLERVFVGLLKVDSHQRGPGEDFVATSTIEMVPGDAAFADLVVHTTTVTTPFDQAQAATTSTTTERHVWDGAAYQLAR